MKRTFFILTALFWISTSLGQSVDGIVKKCFMALDAGDMELFREEYPKLYLQFVKENDYDYIQAVSSLNEGRYSEMFGYLDEIVCEGYMLDEITHDKDFEQVHDLPEWAEFCDRIHTFTADYDNRLRRELNKMQYEDQGIRILLLQLRRSEKDTDRYHARVRQEMKRVDSINAVRVQQLIDAYGWLGESEVGSEANQTLFLTIQHVDDLVVQEKYLPVLERAVEEGNAEPWHFAFLTDRILMNQGKPQIYGTQVILGSTPQESYVVPLQDPENVDILREGVGLEPLDEYLQEEGLEWDLQKYLEDLPRILELYGKRNS